MGKIITKASTGYIYAIKVICILYDNWKLHLNTTSYAIYIYCYYLIMKLQIHLRGSKTSVQVLVIVATLTCEVAEIKNRRKMVKHDT